MGYRILLGTTTVIAASACVGVAPKAFDPVELIPAARFSHADVDSVLAAHARAGVVDDPALAHSLRNDDWDLQFQTYDWRSNGPLPAP